MAPVNIAQLEATGSYVCSAIVNVWSIEALQVASMPQLKPDKCILFVFLLYTIAVATRTNMACPQ